MRKYNLVEKKFFPELNKELWQIIAVSNFKGVEIGDRGGWIESENNLSQYGNAWVRDNSHVYAGALVYGVACVSDNARVCGNTHVYGDAHIYDDAWVRGDADIILLGKLGNNRRLITCFPDKNRKMKISCGCFLGGIEDFEKSVRVKYGNDPNTDYMLILPLLRKKELEWNNMSN